MNFVPNEESKCISEVYDYAVRQIDKQTLEAENFYILIFYFHGKFLHPLASSK